MKKIAGFLFISLVALVSFSAGQTGGSTDAAKTPKPAATPTAPTAATPLELALKSIQFHGGEKFKAVKTLAVFGSTEVSASFGGQTATFPGSFIMKLSGDRYRFDLGTPLRNFSQAYNGEETSSSEPSVSLPPINRLGIPLLQRVGEKDFVVSALVTEGKKKKTGFRVTAPDGYYTDFFVDETTGEVKGYEAAYDFNGRNVSTAVEIDKLREIEGVKIPEKYSQRFELGFGTTYALFKAKEILINTPIPDSDFVLKK